MPRPSAYTCRAEDANQKPGQPQGISPDAAGVHDEVATRFSAKMQIWHGAPGSAVPGDPRPALVDRSQESAPL